MWYDGCVNLTVGILSHQNMYQIITLYTLIVL